MQPQAMEEVSTSQLANCQRKSTFELYNNSTVGKGGGLHAISPSIKTSSSVSWSPLQKYTGARIYFTENTANRGGGLSLEANSKLYILKYDNIPINFGDNVDTNTATFTANSADYVGALYVDDDTNSGTCAGDTKTEC